MKRFLLLIGMSLCLTNSFSQEKMTDAFYLIKDGVLQPGITVDSTQYEPLEMVKHEGYICLKKNNLYNQKLNLNVNSPKPLVLDNKNLVVEYMLPESALCDENHKYNRANNRCAFKNAPTMSVCARGNRNLISEIFIDGKFDANTAKDFVTYNRFSFPMCKDTVKKVSISYIDRWEWIVDKTDKCPDSLKIKSIYYITPETSSNVIYSNQFLGTNTWGEIQHYIKFPSQSVEIKSNSIRYVIEQKMMYMDEYDNWTCSDGSGYLSSELLHGLLVKNAALDSRKKVKETDTLYITPIKLPKNTRTVDVECLIRVDKRMREGARTEQVPVFLKFDNSNQLIRLYGDTIPDVYTKMKVEKSVPVGAKTVSLVFVQAPTATYIVDNLIVSVPKVVSKPKSGPVAGKPVVPQQKK